MSGLEVQRRHEGQGRRSFEERVIAGIFTTFQAMYGGLWTKFVLETGLDLADLKRIWAHELRDWLLRPLVMKFASQNLPAYPPSLPAFRLLCEKYKSPAPVFVPLPAPARTSDELAEFIDTAKTFAKKITQMPSPETLCRAYREPKLPIQKTMLIKSCEQGHSASMQSLKSLIESNSPLACELLKDAFKRLNYAS